jgi:hypothetical protein
MEAEGTARIYTEKMRFVSGTAYPVKKPDAALSFSASPETGAEVKPGIKKSSASIGKLGRKTGR